MRKRFIQSHLCLVDMFLAPSRFLRDRYVDWGIPAEKIRFEEYGRQPVSLLPDDGEERPRNRFGFFGQLSLYKGVSVLLQAMKILAEAIPNRPSHRVNRQQDVEPHLWVHGANLDLQPGTFQNEFRALLEDTKRNVTLVGQYKPGELPSLMANIDWVVVPSIWWENSPLVIQEAFAYGKPVICSDVGGMAEKVQDGVNGLHFHVGDARNLAKVIRDATGTPALWQTLHSKVAPLYPMKDHVNAIAEMYRGLLQRRAAVR